MGCHTWFYKKVDYNIPIEKAREKFIDNLNLSKEFIPENCITEDDLKFWENLHDRQIEKVKKGKADCAVLERLILFFENKELYFIRNLGWFVDHDAYHDVFRIGGYPKDILTSYDETIKFINDNKTKINFNKSFEETLDILKEYWYTNPNGVIDFG